MQKPWREQAATEKTQEELRAGSSVSGGYRETQRESCCWLLMEEIRLTSW